MTFAFGRRRLIVSLISSRNHIVDHYPMAQSASDRELERLNGLRAANEDRIQHQANSVLYGAGWFR